VLGGGFIAWRLQTYYEFPSSNLATQHGRVVMLHPDVMAALPYPSKPCPLNPKLRLPALSTRARCHSFDELLKGGSRSSVPSWDVD
jgi:hypothetical protein